MLKDNQVEPWDIEMSAEMDITDLPKYHLLTDEEYETLQKDKNLEELIFEVYYNSTVPEVPETIKEFIKRAKEETPYPGWGLVTDWLEGVDDYDFDGPMWNYMRTFEEARKVYGNLLAIELKKDISTMIANES